MLDRTAIVENIKRIKDQINGRAALLAATKTVDADTINFAAENGITLIGENRVNELLEKYDKINKDKLDIHFIGKLQTNKVKYIIDKVSMIHSVDSIKLAEEIDKRARNKNICMDVLIEINLADEPSKTGISLEETDEFFEKTKKYSCLRIRGLMAVPPKTAENNKNYSFFKKINEKFIDICTKNVDNGIIDILSIGMSGDYMQALECGSTLVRIGSAIFGERNNK